MKLRLALATVLAVASIGIAGPSINPPAAAASQVSGCFRYANNGAVASSGTAVLVSYTYAGWTNILAYAPTNANGCISWNISGDWRNLYVKIFFLNGSRNNLWYGETPYYAPPGSATYNLGLGWVYYATAQPTYTTIGAPSYDGTSNLLLTLARINRTVAQ